MTKNFKRFMIASVVACSTIQTVPASACGGRGGSGSRGGINIGFGGGGIHAVVRPSVASHSVYRQPVVSQPTYPQPAYAQPTYSQPVYSQPVASQPLYTQVGKSQPVYSQLTQSTPIGSTIPQSQPVTAQNISTTSVSTPAGTTPAAAPPAQTSSVANQPIPSALQMLASLTLDPVAEVDTASNVASIPEFSAAKPAIANANIGTWKVSLPGNQSVELILNENGQFTWTATKAGAANTFSGTYQLENAQLTLVRANDQQQMRGAWTASENGFTFKLDGATTGGLAFTR